MPPPAPHINIHGAPTGTQTERILHDFVRDAVSRLSKALHGSARAFEDTIRLERGADGHFRERKKRIRVLWPMLSDESLRALPDYEPCVECLRSNMVIGRHLDRLVGTNVTASRIEARNILASLILAMREDKGRFRFTSKKFQNKWQELADFFGAERIAYKTVAPLPNLAIPTFPLRLNDELVLDRLTEDEVSRCYSVGVLRPHPLGFPLIESKDAVGIRRTTFVPKVIRQGDEPFEPTEAGYEGSFGKRPLFRDDLTIGDVLSALRLFKRTQIRAAGLAIWIDAPLLALGIQSRVLGWWPYGGGFELSEVDVPQFLELWHLLEERDARFRFSIHRFNLAFEPRLLADQIVDLVIAAEALFLSDLDERYRGELRFRFALRAAKFIEHARYSEHEVFRVMRQAYDARSAIVHGGSPPKETHLPDNQSADLPTFIDTIKELVRLGLRKALSMNDGGKKMRQAEYWDTLVFSKASAKNGHPVASA
jgi:hypothetical protein